MFNSAKKMSFLLLGIDAIVVILLIVQFGVPSLNIGGIFDYYLFYGIIMVIINIALIIRIMFMAETTRFDLLNNKLFLDLKNSIGDFDFENEELFQIESYPNFFSVSGTLSENIKVLLNSSDKTIKNIYLKLSDDTKENNKLNSIFHDIFITYRDEVEERCSAYSKSNFDKIDYIDKLLFSGIAFGIIFILLALMGLNDKTISGQALVRTYVSKYADIERNINIENKKIEQKNIVIGKLNELKKSYISIYGSGSELVNQINKDITELKNSIQ